jgi:hypothetical protein
MFDLSKCKGLGCPVKDRCMRHTEMEFEPQSWIEPSWNGVDCDNCLPMFCRECGYVHVGTDHVIPKG